MPERGDENEFANAISDAKDKASLFIRPELSAVSTKPQIYLYLFVDVVVVWGG